MNIQVNKHQLERVIIKWLNTYFGNLIPKEYPEMEESVFYENLEDKIMIEYDKGLDTVWIRYDEIWSKIDSMFNLNVNEIKSIMKVWLKETYNLDEAAKYLPNLHWDD